MESKGSLHPVVGVPNTPLFNLPDSPRPPRPSLAPAQSIKPRHMNCAALCSRRGRGAKISNGVLRTWDGLEIVSQLRNHHYHNQLNYTEQWSKFYWQSLRSQASLNVETNGLNQRKWQCVSGNNVHWHGISLYAGQTEIEIDASQCSKVSLQSRCALGWCRVMPRLPQWHRLESNIVPSPGCLSLNFFCSAVVLYSGFFRLTST